MEVSCSLCSQSFTEYRLERHIQEVHIGTRPEYEWDCGQCAFKGIGFSEIAAHLLTSGHDPTRVAQNPSNQKYWSRMFRCLKIMKATMDKLTTGNPKSLIVNHNNHHSSNDRHHSPNNHYVSVQTQTMTSISIDHCSAATDGKYHPHNNDLSSHNNNNNNGGKTTAAGSTIDQNGNPELFVMDSPSLNQQQQQQTIHGGKTEYENDNYYRPSPIHSPLRRQQKSSWPSTSVIGEEEDGDGHGKGDDNSDRSSKPSPICSPSRARKLWSKAALKLQKSSNGGNSHKHYRSKPSPIQSPSRRICPQFTSLSLDVSHAALQLGTGKSLDSSESPGGNFAVVDDGKPSPIHSPLRSTSSRSSNSNALATLLLQAAKKMKQQQQREQQQQEQQQQQQQQQNNNKKKDYDSASNSPANVGAENKEKPTTSAGIVFVVGEDHYDQKVNHNNEKSSHSYESNDVKQQGEIMAGSSTATRRTLRRRHSSYDSGDMDVNQNEQENENDHDMMMNGNDDAIQPPEELNSRYLQIGGASTNNNNKSSPNLSSGMVIRHRSTRPFMSMRPSMTPDVVGFRRYGAATNLRRRSSVSASPIRNGTTQPHLESPQRKRGISLIGNGKALARRFSLLRSRPSPTYYNSAGNTNSTNNIVASAPLISQNSNNNNNGSELDGDDYQIELDGDNLSIVSFNNNKNNDENDGNNNNNSNRPWRKSSLQHRASLRLIRGGQQPPPPLSTSSPPDSAVTTMTGTLGTTSNNNNNNNNYAAKPGSFSGGSVVIRKWSSTRESSRGGRCHHKDSWPTMDYDGEERDQFSAAESEHQTTTEEGDDSNDSSLKGGGTAHSRRKPQNNNNQRRSGLEHRFSSQSESMNRSSDLSTIKTTAKRSVAALTSRGRSIAKTDLNIDQAGHFGHKAVVCRICQRPFSSVDNLSKHQKLHSRGVRLLKCHYCYAIFSDPSKFRNHEIENHTKDWPYKCLYGCGKGVTRHHWMIAHQENCRLRPGYHDKQESVTPDSAMYL